MKKLIENIKTILELKADWDDNEGIPVNSIAFKKAMELLFRLLNQGNIIIPDISSCGDGSLDMCWQTTNARLLINISEGLIDWYGENSAKHKIYRKQKNTYNTKLYKFVRNNFKIITYV